MSTNTSLDPSLQALGSALPPCQEGETTDQIIKMRGGKSYQAMDAYLHRLRNRGLEIQQEFNKFPTDNEGRMRFMQTVCDFEEKGEGHRVCVLPGFICEYWFNISFGRDIFAAHNLFIADVAPVHIGTRTMIGPNCQFLTPTHPLSPEERNGVDGPEAAGPIWIGNDVWIGGGVIILANVTIGDGCTVGAGSVVTKSVPPRTVVVGNPAKPIKRINADGTTVDIRGEKL